MKKNDNKNNNPEHAGIVGAKRNNNNKFSPDNFYPDDFYFGREVPKFKYEDKHGV